MRIRHYGLLANRCRAQCLAQARDAIAAVGTDRPEHEMGSVVLACHPSTPLCPRCHQAVLHTVHRVAPNRLEGG